MTRRERTAGGQRADRAQVRGRRQLRQSSLEQLEPRLALAAFTAGDLLVSSAPFNGPSELYEFAPTGGAPLQTIPLSHPSNVVTEKPRDLVMDSNGRVQIYNGTFDPRLTTYDPTTDTFTNARFPFWSTGSGITYGGLAALNDFVFATDMKVRSDTDAYRGVVRFNIDNLASGWSREANPNIGDTSGNTATIIPHITVHGTGDGSFDYYSFYVPNAGARGIFDIDGGDTGGPGSFYSYLRLYDSNQNVIATSDLSSSITAGAEGSTSTRDAYLEYTFPTAGTYIVEVGSCCGPNGVPEGASYDLQISIPGHSEYILGGSGQLTDAEPNDTLFSSQNTDSAERFGAADGDVIDVAMGLDGLLYALTYTGHSSGGGNVVKVFDPSTLQLKRTVTLPYVHKGIAVDAAGNIYTTFPDIYKYSPNGVPLNAIASPVEGVLGDIDIKPESCFAGVPSDGCLAIASSNGSIVLTDPSFADVDFFSARQGDGLTSVAFVTEPLSLPHASDDSYRINEDTNGNTLNVLINDLVDSRGKLVITAVGAPSAGGAVTISGGASLRYSPAPNYSGQETFTYTVSDSLGGQDTATVTVDITNVNEPPTANPDNFTVTEDSGTSILDPLANDSFAPDLNETLTLIAVDPPSQGGTVSISPGNATVQYTPAANFAGDETFTYTIDDGNGGTATGTVTVTVTNVDDPPTAVDDSFAVNPNSSNNPLDVLANDSAAPDTGETITIVANTSPLHGDAQVFGGTLIRYTPTAGYLGPDSFTYTIQDSSGSLATATVTLAVTVVNQPPTALPDSYNINHNSQNNNLPVLNNDTFAPDVGETLTIVAVSTPNHGGFVTIAANGTTLRYSPAGGYEGPETFQYTISDGNGGEASATVSITVGQFNSTPVPEDDYYLIVQNSSANVLDVLANDFDPDGDGLTIVSTGATSAGGVAVVSADSGSILYAPPHPFLGFETFKYTVSDGKGGTAEALVTIEVRGWQNPANPFDTDGDTFVAPHDAVVLINELNQPTLIAADGKLPLAPPLPPIYYDVNGDGYLSAVDVLMVVNALNAASGGEGEAALPASPPLASAPTTPVGAWPAATTGLGPVAVLAANVVTPAAASSSAGTGAGPAVSSEDDSEVSFEQLLDLLARLRR